MGMQINTNIAALNSYRNLSSTQNDLSKSLEKLSSGLRINRAADDAAGLAISEGLRAQIGGLTVAARNAQDGISVIQTVEGSLTEVHSILQRMRDLAVQAGNDSNSDEARGAITTEANALVSELSRISSSTNFNGIQLLDGSEGSLSFQVGADGDASSQIQVSLANANVSDVAATLGNASSGATAAVLTPTDVTGAMTFSITEADASTSTVTTASVGGAGSITTVQQLADILNADTAFSGKLVAGVNADNELTVTALSGGSVVGGATAGTDASAGTGVSVSAAAAGPAGLDFSSATGAAAAITLIDGQITAISTARAELGAVQNRFESAINTLNVSKENITAAESRIRDTDMAEEMVNYTRANLLSQAGTAMLAQANQSNSGILQLLR
ncbi:flagellin [Glaciibacter superstes]|uniref:flagellin N-terminal helical domain-containing protein n=1 Tax=Glaciibacter superstes TaxID=501023 RepID=UPI00047CDAA1|nr:flagellin [Glaciibacter superstes]